MKTRTDFVTNSSSSSFIIAVRNDATAEDILTVLKGHEKSIRSFVKNDLEYTDFGEQLVEEDILDEEVIYSRVLDELVEKFLDVCADMKIDNWKLEVLEGGNEGGSSLLGNFLYSSLSHVETEKFKITSS